MATPADVMPSIVNILGAVGALGVAAVGLVDTTKAFAGGLSNAGFKFIRSAVVKLLDGGMANSAATGTAFGNADVIATLRANWMNGVSKADQKAAAKSLIRLSLTTANAASIAGVVGVDARALQAVVARIYQGEALGAEDLNLLGRFDTIVSATLDEAYERGDQAYRNVSKVAAALVAIGLALIGGYVLNGASPSDYLLSKDAAIAFLVGAVSTPLAPMTKDLASALAAATKAVGSIRR